MKAGELIKILEHFDKDTEVVCPKHGKTKADYVSVKQVALDQLGTEEAVLIIYG